MRKWLLLSALILLLSVAAVLHWESGAGAVERHYQEIQAGMTEAEVSAILGTERTSRVEVSFSFGEGKYERRVASVWRLTEWGRPFFLLVGFDHAGGVSWKQIIKGAAKKLGHWLFNREAEYFFDPCPLRIEVVKEGMDQ